MQSEIQLIWILRESKCPSELESLSNKPLLFCLSFSLFLLFLAQNSHSIARLNKSSSANCWRRRFYIPGSKLGGRGPRQYRCTKGQCKTVDHNVDCKNNVNWCYFDTQTNYPNNLGLMVTAQISTYFEVRMSILRLRLSPWVCCVWRRRAGDAIILQFLLFAYFPLSIRFIKHLRRAATRPYWGWVDSASMESRIDS